jgi:LysM repeat protein
MNDLYKAIDALNEISQAEMTARRKAEMDAAIKKAQNMQGSGKAVSDALRAAARAEKAYVKAASGAGAPTQDDVYRDIAADAIKQDAADKAAGIASYDEYLAGYQKNLDAIKAAGVNLDDVYATANKMLSTEKGAARLSGMGINDDDDLISYVMAKAGIADQTPDKYAYAPGGYMHPEIEKYYNKAKAEVKEDLTFETEEELEERVTYSTLAKLSGIEDPNKIYPGQKITLPGGGSYTVKSGDTLSGIAQNYRLKKIGQPKSGKLDDPTTKIPQVPNKLGPDGQYDGDDLGNAPTTPDEGPGDFEVPSQYAGDDTDDMLNKYAKLPGGKYKLDPKSIKQPGLPIYRQIDPPTSAKASDADLAAQYAKNINPKMNVKPVVTPSAVSADDAIGKSGEKAIQAVKKDIDQSYTKKGVSSLYNRLKDLF